MMETIDIETILANETDLLSEAASESLVSLRHSAGPKRGEPLRGYTREQADERDAFIAHCAWLLNDRQYDALGRVLGPVLRAYIEALFDDHR